jgi:negative regulator of sigma E activity
MNREFNDELLSAYLDGQLASAELAAVEAHLASNPDARQLLSELRMLSDEVRALPRQSAGPQFADRVLQAAVAAKAGQAMVSPAASNKVSGDQASGDKVRRGSRLPVVLAGVAAIAAAVALAVWINGGTGTTPVPGGNNNITKVSGSGDPTIPTLPAVSTAAEAALAHLRQASPQEGEVVVVRVRMAPGMSAVQAIDKALTAAGIASVAGDQPTVGGNAGAAYRQQLATQFAGGPQELQAATNAAADAVFVESSWGALERAVGALAADPKQALELQALAKVAAKLPVVNPGEANGEGETGPKAIKPPQGDFAQRLPASIFRLPKAAAEPITAPPAVASIEGQRKVRVLLLVEQAK